METEAAQPEEADQYRVTAILISINQTISRRRELEVLTAVSLKVLLFLYVTPHRVVNSYRRFG
jgi:hypothetical protein